MESVYEKVVKLTAEILKSWKSDPGVVSPFSSSSSMHPEINDNHLEHYVKKDPDTPLNDAIASIFNSNFWTNGGDKMTDKTLDVNASETTVNSYINEGSSTTEPDPQSEIAITKSAEIPTTHVGTTANTTTDAPAKGETTEPVEKAADCSDCGKSMTLCECSGMTKAEGDKCPHCGQAMPIAKAADEPESKEEEAKETPEDEKKEEMKKTLWSGQFSPNIKRGL
jgi:hypothetical protein